MKEFEKRLKIIAEEEKSKLKETGIKTGHISEIKVNKRLKRRLGQCIKKSSGEYEIQIAEYLENSTENLIREVVMHELIHTCRGCMNHGKKWKIYAEIMNREYGYNITRVYKEDKEDSLPERKYKYLIKCTSCGNTGYRVKRSKVIDNPKNYKCSRCGGKIVVEEI